MGRRPSPTGGEQPRAGRGFPRLGRRSSPVGEGVDLLRRVFPLWGAAVTPSR